MKYAEIIAKLNELAKDNDEYRRFNARIVNDPSVEFIGVRMPDLRKIAKEIAKNDWRKFLDENTWKTQEEKLLAVMLPAYIRPQLSFNDLFSLFDELIPHISSWALTDTLAMKYAQIQQSQAKAWLKIKKFTQSENFWEVRFGLIMMMVNFLNDEYIDEVMVVVKNLKSNEYYVKMGAAWLLATAAINYREKVEQVLPEIEPQTAKFTRQKMRDSFRIK